MKKFFQTIGIISLLCFSFIYTEKTVTVVKEFDDIMVQIKKASEDSRVEAIEGEVSDNTIIPGISGSEIDIDKSYSKMKRYGKYNEKLLEYTSIKPNINLYNNINKYIIKGNKNKNMVSLLFLVDSNDSVTNILNTLKSKDIKATFFLDGNWVEKNNDVLINIINDGHEIGNLGYNYTYTTSSFSWLDSKIKKTSGQGFSYCYHKTDNNDALMLCAMNGNFSIKPSIEVNQNPTITIKEKLSAGDLIGIEVTDELERELSIILTFINSKGYKMATLGEHLQE